MSEVIRIQKLPPEPLPAPKPPLGGVHPPCRIVGADGEVERLPQATGFPVPPAPAEEGLEFEAYTIMGRRLSVGEINETTRLRYRGAEMSAKSAVALGLIVKGEDGKYRLPTPEERPEAAPEEEPITGMPDLFGEELNDFAQQVDTLSGSPQRTDRLAGAAIQGAARGDVSQAAKDLVNLSGSKLDPASATELIHTALERGSQDVAAFVTRNFKGVDGKAVIEWASTLPAAQRTNIATRLYHGDRTCLPDLVAQYRQRQLIEGSKIKK